MQKIKEPENETSVFRQGEDRIRSVVSDVEKKLKQGEEQVRNLVTNVDKQLHKNPWPIVAGVAASCLFMGFIMGTTKRNS